MQARIPEVTLLDELGRGPGSIVYRGFFRGSACIVKLPSARLPARVGLGSSFEQDLLQLARLGKPGLPRVLQVDATDETPYAIVATADGRPLVELLETHLTEQECIEIALQLTAALSQLHAVGFVHGDVSCQRVLVSDVGLNVTLVDHGSVLRPIAFDPAADLLALGLVLKQLAWRVGDPRAGLSGLARIADQWAETHAPLEQLMLELGVQRDALAQRDTLPPPGLTSAPPSLSLEPPASARAELSQLRGLWELGAEHEGKVVIVAGQAGSGKSRILRGFMQQLSADGVHVLGLKCANSDWAPFSAIKRLLENHLASLPLLAPEQRAQVESALRTAAGPLASHLRLLSPRLAKVFRDAETVIRAGDAQEVFIAGLSEFLSKYLESIGRAAVVVDDVHWLDASSRLVLSRLTARLCPQGYVFVCSARDDEEGREAIERFDAMLPSGVTETLALGPLGERDARNVVAEFLGTCDRANAQDDIAEQLSRLSDGTPFCLLELLGLALEQRLLRLRAGVWQLDSKPVQQMRLPGSSQALIERRLALLEDATLTVLHAAAVVRAPLDVALLARITKTSLENVRLVLDRAAGARLLVRSAEAQYAFLHDCVWEALLRGLPTQAQRALHQRVADALTAEGGVPAPEHEYELARHHVAGLLEPDPRRAYEVLRHAGQRAIAACDDTLALTFLKPAERAAELANIDLDRAFYVDIAESSLRTGASHESLAYFAHALKRSAPGFEAAHVRGRIAWIHHQEANTEECWNAVQAALQECGRTVPGDGPLALVGAGMDRWVRPHLPGERALSQAEGETLCGLYAMCMRVALESGKPARALASVVHLSSAAAQLKPCRALVQAELMTAFGMALISPHTPWRARVERAQAIARELADPIAQTNYHQSYHVIAGWHGDFEECERQAHLCVVERGHFMEIGELCTASFGMYAAYTLLGKPEVALTWAERAIARVQQSARAPVVFALLEEAACATLHTLGREHEIPELKRRLLRVQRAEIRPGSYLHLLSFQNRMQHLTASDEPGEDFEALVDEWSALGQNPKQAHLVTTIYYAHLAHARVHQCLRARPNARRALVRKLGSALHDLEAAAREPVVAAHARVARAAYHWFRGEDAEAERSVVEAEALARQTNCVWVSYAAARLRAHMLKARGKLNSARDEARVAEQLAERYGPPSRLRFIQEEFDLSEERSRREAEPETPSVRRHLDALLHIAQASSRDLGPKRQARFIVDELLQTVTAERGFLFMRDATSGRLQCHAARSQGGADLAEPASHDLVQVEQVYATGQTLLAGTAAARTNPFNTERVCIVVALVLREQVVGVLYLDRAAAAGIFGAEDVALLEALANQVPVVLELADALRERERLERNLRQAQKMEAIGRLAGGIAHDFNNILATIEFAAGCLATRGTGESDEDVDEIRNAARRGAELTRQLLMFSRGKSVPPRRIELGEIVQRVAPMLSRLVRSDVHIELQLSEEAPLPAMADPSHVERLLMNLCGNASDAMPHGGTITIRLGRATPSADDESTDIISKGGYAELTVSDSGTGMTEEVRARLFEPFFTTKSSQHGTGLGLAIVYAIVQQYGGQIEVASELGMGTTFRVYLPLCSLDAKRERVGSGRSALTREPRARFRRQHTGSSAVIVVDDDDILRRQTARVLQSAGYEVLTARDGEDALRVIADATNLPDLAVTDLQMPCMDGVQLAARLRSSDPTIRLLFVSGDGADSLGASGLLSYNARFLQKPFQPEELLREVAALLHHSPDISDALSGDVDADELEQPM